MVSTHLSSWLFPPLVILSAAKDLVAQRARSFADAQDDIERSIRLTQDASGKS